MKFIIGLVRLFEFGLIVLCLARRRILTLWHDAIMNGGCLEVAWSRESKVEDWGSQWAEDGSTSAERARGGCVRSEETAKDAKRSGGIPSGHCGIAQSRWCNVSVGLLVVFDTRCRGLME